MFDTLLDLRRAAATCTDCGLSETRSQVVVGSGETSSRLMVVGEAPGANEDELGEPFVGRSGALLLALVDEVLGLSRHEIYITNVVKCRPPANRDPRVNEVSACLGYLVDEMRLVDPLVVVTVGNAATRAVLGTRDGISTLRGRIHTSTISDAPVVPTFHPAAALRGGPAVVASMRSDLMVVGTLLAAAG